MSRYVRTANKMKDKMEDNDHYPIKVFLEKYYYDEYANEQDGEESDTNRLLKEQLNRMRKDVRGRIVGLVELGWSWSCRVGGVSGGAGVVGLVELGWSWGCRVAGVSGGAGVVGSVESVVELGL